MSENPHVLHREKLAFSGNGCNTMVSASTGTTIRVLSLGVSFGCDATGYIESSGNTALAGCASFPMNLGCKTLHVIGAREITADTKAVIVCPESEGLVFHQLAGNITTGGLIVYEQD